MVNQETRQLADRLSRLELHAAHSGREVLRVLVNNLLASHETTATGLLAEQSDNFRCLLRVLPPYAPPLNNINRILLLMEAAVENNTGVSELKHQLEELQKHTIDARLSWKGILTSLAKELPDEAVVYTHTLSETVLGVLTELHRMGKIKRVNVTESRPNNDGWETARRLAELDVDTHLYIDAAMPAAIENAHLMLSGAEIINQDGSVVGKVGAYPAAQFCQHFGKPVYIVADTNKINHMEWHNFHINPLTALELGFDGSQSNVQISGTLFDLTPAQLIHAYATELGILTASDIPTLDPEHRVSKWLVKELGQEKQELPR
jgi:translation initiation factor 2B subunit (eIF-2B alpha/beta/delta family)